jgi:nucleoside-diphosphate-sugar epimerase
MKCILVTGSAGFIGSHVCDALLDAGHQVIGIDDFSAGDLGNVMHLEHNPNFTQLTCDITDRDSLQDVFDYYHIDVIFNLAASKKNICLKDPHRDLEVNAGGTLHLLQLAEQYGVEKFVHSSTGSVYGEAEIFPQDEEHPCNPTSYYGVSKLAGERYVNMYAQRGLNTTILRYFHVYGPRQCDDDELGGVVAIFAKKMRENDCIVIHGDGEQLRSFTYVADVVAANLAAMTSPASRGKVYNVASGTKTTINALVTLMSEYIPNNCKVIHGTELEGDISYFSIDNRLIRNELGVSFREPLQGLKEYLCELN